jgi:hypothetical protein
MKALLVVILPLFFAPTTFAQRSSSQAPTTQQSSHRESYSDKYAMLADHNIFVRDRTHLASRRNSPTTQQSSSPRKTLEETTILRGVVLEDGAFRAYIEDENQKLNRHSVGDKLAHGRVAAIDIDAIVYDADGKPKWIDIGSDLTGHAVAAIESPTFSDEPSTQPTTGPAINPNDPNLTLEQRLKLRRLQELKK